MIRHDSFFKRLKRGGSLFLAVLLAVQSFFNVGFGIISADASEGENRGSTFAYYGSQNLLKEGASFPFYGKNHNRVGLWPYGITNVEGGHSAPGYCLEPNKSMLLPAKLSPDHYLIRIPLLHSPSSSLPPYSPPLLALRKQ